MSERPAKPLKAIAMASASVLVIVSLPPELLDTILGFLDVRTLCTARLVCAQFRTAATQFLSSVELSVETLRNGPETTLNNFPNLGRVTIFDVEEDDLVMLTEHPLAHAVTHVRAVRYLMPVREVHYPMPLFGHGRIAPRAPSLPHPNLVSLTLRNGVNTIFPFPETLRELILGECFSERAASRVTRLTNLTCLQINSHARSFEGVTALTALQRLEIYGKLSLIPFVAQLTLLTHLRFKGHCWSASPSELAPLAFLTRLHRLVHLGFSAVHSYDQHVCTSVECQVLSSLGTFTGLRSLDLGLSRQPEPAFRPVSMTPFSQLTALRLRNVSYTLDASFLPRFSLERLQDLSLSRGVKLDRDVAAALRRATGLTHLEVWTARDGAGAGLRELEMALPCMSRLRSLTLSTPDKPEALAWGSSGAVHARFSLKPIARLTELTILQVGGWGVTTKADVDVCLGLKKLRVLRMAVDVDSPTPAPSERITRESLLAVATLPELCKLEIGGSRGVFEWNLTDDMRALLHTERQDKGWPPLEVKIYVAQ